MAPCREEKLLYVISSRSAIESKIYIRTPLLHRTVIGEVIAIRYKLISVRWIPLAQLNEVNYCMRVFRVESIKLACIIATSTSQFAQLLREFLS